MEHPQTSQADAADPKASNATVSISVRIKKEVVKHKKRNAEGSALRSNPGGIPDYTNRQQGA